MIEEFKKELNELLTKYPTLGRLTIYISDRVSISHSSPEEILYNEAAKINKIQSNTTHDSPVKALESKITPEYLDSLDKSITVERI